MSETIANLMRAAALAPECGQSQCNRYVSRELRYWADRLDVEYGPTEIEYERTRSVDGKWYNVPKNENLSAQLSGYQYAALIKDKELMAWYEDGNTGWIPVEDE